MMKTVTLDVQTPEQVGLQFVDAWKSGTLKKNARISFTSPELLWKVLSAKRWDILKALCGVGPVSIRETSRRVERDVKAVHRDVTALLAAGLLQKNEQGLVEFPYDAVKVEFLLEAA
jgi:predicted transcriptional regulator